jgi:hypothetical protein
LVILSLERMGGARSDLDTSLANKQKQCNGTRTSRALVIFSLVRMGWVRPDLDTSLAHTKKQCNGTRTFGYL